MVDNLKVVSELSRNQWSEFIRKHPQGNIFQSPEMFDLWNHTVNFEPVLVGVLSRQKKIVGVLLGLIQKESSGLLGYFSSRCIVWGGPLIESDDTRFKLEVTDIILESLVETVKNKTIFIQFRNLFELGIFKKSFEKHGFKWNRHLNIQVKTGISEDVNKKMSASKIRQIKKSFKSGAEIVEAENLDQVREFYQLLKNLYKTKVRKPLPDWSFFKSFFQFSQKKKIGKYFLVRFDNQIVGGIMCPITKNRIIYEWYICGSDGKFPGIFPSVLATWAPIDFALKNHFEYFDFMGAGKPDQDYGVREFKLKFGGNIVEFGRFEKINKKWFYGLGKMGLKMIGALRK